MIAIEVLDGVGTRMSLTSSSTSTVSTNPFSGLVVNIRHVLRIRWQVLATTAALLVAAGDLIPVDHVPPGVKVLWTAVLILEIVGVLPNIVAHDRVQTVHKWAVLV